MDKIIDQSKIFPFELIRWYRDNHRKLPWRETKDPYKIWLSEIILQQTRVAQGQKYYEHFVSKYPLVEDLANASEEEVLKDWQGLGYYSRARNLRAAANSIVEDHGGTFPSDYSSIRQLKGVGDYTAAAISSFAFDQPHAVVDGNVYRLLSRYFGITTPIDSTAGKKEFATLANELLLEGEAATYNQAIMEFGALQCSPKSPDCSNCPLVTSCYAHQNNLVDQLPIKEKKVKVRNRYFHYFIIQNDNKIIIKQRSEKDIWQNLFDFPLIEENKLMKWGELSSQLSNNYNLEAESDEKKHILSHQIIHCKFFHLRAPSKGLKAGKNEREISLEKLVDYPVPKLIENYLREETNLLSLLR